ncbi:hypothetical protein B2I21_09715 [Chryseobacterium mucoviscidosis]|nr:hypothetical protein B2I21_09715 [Chryseobacterium mucoviscidosis]
MKKLSILKKLKESVYKIFVYCIKVFFLLLIFSTGYTLIGFPIAEDDFMKILPSLITITSVLLVFYNVNRTQQKNFENENKKFRRDARIKVADEFIDCFSGMDDFMYDVNTQLNINSYNKEASDLLRETFHQHYRKIRSIMYKRKEIIDYCESIYDNKTDRFFLTYNLLGTLHEIQMKLIQLELDKENWTSNLEEVKRLIKEDILKHREEVAKSLYGAIFKHQTFDDLSIIGKLKYSTGKSGMILYFFPIGFLLSLALLFKDYFLHLFIK